MNNSNDKRNSTLKQLWSYLKEYQIMLILILLTVIVSSVISILPTRMIGYAIDEFIIKKDLAGLLKIVYLLIAIYLFTSLITWIQNTVSIKLIQEAVYKMRQDIFSKIQLLPLGFFDKTPHGDILSRVTNDVDNIGQTLSSGLSQIVSSLITVVGIFIIMLLMNPVLTLVCMILIPLLLILTKQITKRSRKFFEAQQKELGNINSFIEEHISAQDMITVYHQEDATIEEFKEQNEILTKESIKAQIVSSLTMPLASAFNSLSFALVTIVGIMYVVKGKMTLGQLTSFSTYSKQFSRPLSELASQINQLQSAMASATRVFEIINMEPEDAGIDYSLNLPEKLNGNVKFQDVTFSYIKGEEILKNIKLEAKPGETIAFVGPTGAGKTTVINLITRFYDLDSGKILIDGHDIKEIDRNELRLKLGLVLQDTYLFTASIKDNIRLARPEATMDEVISAAKLANAHDFIIRLPDAYDTLITEGGTGLSQGQRQMLAIARTILSEPEILILDEATSSIDTRTEVHIQEAMDNLMKGRTSFVIAHRLSTIQKADKIIVINEGLVEESGNHNELIEKKGFYYDLYMNQFE